MSLLQKASIITTPTAYAEDYLYSIKPAYALGENLVSNGGFDTDTDWSKTTGWTISGGKANWNPAVAPYNNDIYRAFSFVEGTRYRITFTMSNNTTGRILLRLSGTGNQDVNGGYTYYANGTHTVEFKAQANKNFLRIYGHDSYSSFSIDDFSLKIITDADFDFDRNSTGTRVNEDYLIEDVPYNLTTYSEDFSQWTLNGDSVVLQNETYLGRPIYKLTDASGALGIYNDNTGNIVGQTYIISLIAKKDTSNIIRLRYGGSNNKNVQFNLDTGVITSEDSGVTGAIQNLGNGFYQISSTIASLIHSTISYAIYTDNGSVLITSAQIVKGDQPKDYLKTTDRLDIPRIDYTNGEPSILLEPSRTNLVPYSNDFSNSAWTKSASTINSNAIISPDGTSNAVKLVENSANTEHAIFDNVITSTGDFSISIMVKASERSRVRVSNGSNSHRADFDLSNGNISNKVSVTADMISMPNDWYLCKISYNISSTAAQYMFLSLIDNSGNVSYQGDGSSGVYIYGAQLEAGSYATSLIHTSGSAVTRSADAANNAGNSDLINSTEGVLYAEFKGQNDNTFNYISVSDGGTTNYAAILCSDVDNEIAYRYYVSNSGVQIVTSVSNLLEFNKIAVKWKVNDFSIYINGVQVGASTSGSVNSAGTLNNVSFARGTSNNTPFYGNFKSVMVFKEALTDLELEKLTGYNNHELYMNYYNRLSYLGLVEEYNVESDINNYIL